MSASISRCGAMGAGRYAPSPSSALHLGNLRTAVVAWLVARTTDRRFLLRIDDLDRDRSRTEVAHQQIADLTDLGLDFDPPLVWQSERDDAYSDALGQLDTYECFCSRREIADAVRAPHLPVDAYPGTCAELTEPERVVRRAERPAALRVRAAGDTMTVTDRWTGEVTGNVDDFVVRRNDGTFAYNLAVVVDDACAGVDQVIRGADLLGSAPRQAWLAEQLSHPIPSYGHVPLVTGVDGRRLAKRDGAVTLADLASAGEDTAAVLGRIAVSLDLATPGEPVTLDHLRARFDPSVAPRPWVVEG
ncbi:MAG: tRNA glutamyl-Q(34) synthetase GluQRS [Propionibacteriales bacterium]|nr:tRNA glutamyl-Q(34) synthetase GluQRS [Propionibacteriales bacterium]